MKHKLTYKLIKRAVSGDVIAINRIVAIYEPYINTLASKSLYDAEGNEYIMINVDLKDHLTSKLINLIHRYKIA